MVDGDQSSGAGADRTPPLGARGRSSSFPNPRRTRSSRRSEWATGRRETPRPARRRPAGRTSATSRRRGRARRGTFPAGSATPVGGAREEPRAPERRRALARRGIQVHARRRRWRRRARGGGVHVGGGDGHAEPGLGAARRRGPRATRARRRRRRRVLVRRKRTSRSRRRRSRRDGKRRGGSSVAAGADADGLARREPREFWRTPHFSRVLHAPRPRRPRARAPADAVAASAGFAPPRPSVFGPFDVSDADGFAPPPLASSPSPPLAFPPNTPIVRFLSRARWGVGGLGGYDKMGGGAAGGWHGWHVPGGTLVARASRRGAAGGRVTAGGRRGRRRRPRPCVEGRGRRSGGRKRGGRRRGVDERVAPLSRAGGGGGVGRIERVDARALRASIDAIVHAASGIARATSRRDALRDAVGERLGSADETSRERSGDGGERTRSRPSLAALRGCSATRSSTSPRCAAASRRSARMRATAPQ